MSNTEDKIDLLYPDSPNENTTDTTKDTSPTVASSDAISLLYGEAENSQSSEQEKPTGNPYSLEKGSTEDTLYGSESKIDLSEETDLSIIYNGEEEQAARENLGYMANEVGATQNDIHEMVSHANRQIVSGVNATVDESINTLFEEHGSSLKDKLTDAQDLVKSMPDLAAWLDETKLGNDPTMVNKIIKIAQSPRAKARLQKLRSK